MNETPGRLSQAEDEHRQESVVNAPESAAERRWVDAEVKFTTDIPFFVPVLFEQVCNYIGKHGFDHPHTLEIEVRVRAQGCVSYEESTDFLNHISYELHGASVRLLKDGEADGG